MPSARPHHRLCRLLCRLVLALARRQERAVKLDEMMKLGEMMREIMPR